MCMSCNPGHKYDRGHWAENGPRCGLVDNEPWGHPCPCLLPLQCWLRRCLLEEDDLMDMSILDSLRSVDLVVLAVA